LATHFQTYRIKIYQAYNMKAHFW